jgi:hypothetical protein
MTLRYTLFLAAAAIAAVGFWLGRNPKRPSPPVRSVPAAAKLQPPIRTDSSYIPFGKLSWEARHSILSEIEELGVEALFASWVAAGRVDHDLMKQGSLGALLAKAIKQGRAGPSELRTIRNFILDPANSLDERERLSSSMSLAATSATLDIVLQVAETSESDRLRRFAVSLIADFGRRQGDGREHEELSPPLERVWLTTKNVELLESVATAMAGIGAEKGLNLLLNSSLDGGFSVRRRIAADVLENTSFFNPNGIRAVASLLFTHPIGSKTQRFAADLLANSGGPVAAESLLKWVRQAEGAGSSVEEYVARTKAPGVWQAALDSGATFRNPNNREAIRRGLEKYHSQRKLG